MSELDRRDFLKLFGAGTAAASTGCYRYSELPEKLIPYVIQPEEITPGLPVLYASTCQECPAACGLHVRTREGRPIKLEGNPEHPVNKGSLCARGQAGLGRAYHPERYTQPLQRGSGGDFSPIGWEEATAELAGKLDAAGGHVAVLGGVTGPTLSGLIDGWLESVGGGTRVVYEPFAHEALRAASRTVFGVDSRPIFDLEGADLVVDFGANSLASWISPVEHARQIMDARDASLESGRAMRLVYVGPRQDETASSADEWLPARPGTEGVLALGLARVVMDTTGNAVGGDGQLLSRVLADYDATSVASRTGVSAEDIQRLGRTMASASKVVALPPGISSTSRRATASAAAVLVLNAVLGAVGQGVQLPPAGSQPRVDDFRDVVKLIDAMKSGDVKVLVIHDSNPLYSLPADAGFEEALAAVDLVVSTASLPDETSQRADLILPDHSALESWGDAEPQPGIRSVVQPTLRPLYDTRALGDTLLATARATRSGGAGLPAGDFRDAVEAAFTAEGLDWNEALAHGGAFAPQSFDAAIPVQASVSRLEFEEPSFEGEGTHVLLPVPSTLLSDGRGASLAWLQETPDPITKIAWQSWAEISQSTAERLGVGPGDVIAIQTTYGSLEVPVWPRGAIRDDVVAVATGQGHTVGRYASLEEDGTPGGARGVNVNDALPALTDESGGRAWLTARASLRSTGEYRRLPFTQGTDNKRGRLLGESISLVALASGENPFAANEGLPGAGGHGGGHGEDHGGGHGDHAGAGGAEHHEGPHEMRRYYDPADDTTDGEPYRWGMTIDVDRCTGCSACVVACALENNVPQLGEESVLRNRQMSWLRIERYVGDGFRELETGRPGPKNHEKLGDTDVRNSPMLCQQCGAAPCEPVCPVIATYHTSTGLNAMVYNRCIGTRYCSNNCPYKVRRFNWFDYQIEGWPDPMPLMLNPDVTVRGQGVMEKCTFCVQRIQADRLQAKQEGRALGDEIQTACQQTCPTEAIVFGNYKDPKGRASELVEKNEGRAYHALHVLNTRPGITYLAKVDRRETAHDAHASGTKEDGRVQETAGVSRPLGAEAGEERA